MCQKPASASAAVRESADGDPKAFSPGGRRQLPDGHSGVKGSVFGGLVCLTGLVLVVLLVVGCRPTTQAEPEAPVAGVVLTDVLVSAPQTAGTVGTEALAVADTAVRRAVDDAPFWGVDAGPSDRLGGRLDVLLEAVPHAGDRLGVRLSMAFVPARRSRLVEPVQTVGATMVAGEHALETSIRALAETGLRALEAQIAVMIGTDAEVLGALGAQDGELRRVAIREAQSRQLTAAIPRLRERLEALDVAGDATTHREFVSVVGALATLGDRASVPAIIEAVPLSEGALLVAIMPALSRLGGGHAAEFLEVVASGHALPAVREAARQARTDLAAHP